MYFEYGENEILYLKSKDRKLAEVIEKIGLIKRETDTDLFSSVIHHIIGQQISTKAQVTIWQRMKKDLTEVTAETILSVDISKLQSYGMTFRKAEYITDFSEKVHSDAFNLDAVWQMTDEEAIRELSSLKGIGIWTAEMILLFCMQRPNIFSYDDLAIQRGLRMVYHHRNIDRKLFEKYRRRFSPYCSVASLYLWAVAGGAIPEMKDYKPKTTKRRKNEMANIIVLFEVTPTKEGMQKYLDLAAMLKPMLAGFEGFIRAERFSSLNEEGKLLSMNIWTDEAAVEHWRNVMQHRISQKEGREKLFESYKITVCSEIRSYTDKDRSQAPQDSNAFFEV